MIDLHSPATDHWSAQTSGTTDGRKSRIETTLFTRAARAPARALVRDGARSWDYGMVADLARDFASRLLARGCEPGDRVAVMLEKSLDAVIALYGTWTAGGVVVPVNESLRLRQLSYVLEHSGAKLLVTQSRILQRVDATLSARFPVLDVGRETPPETTRQPPACPGGQEPAAILYTSGSTGRPKGILISHANLLAGARIVSGYLDIRDDERIISVLPFNFDYGLNQLLIAVHAGATLVLQRSHFPADICRTLVEQGITAMAAVPPLWIQLMQKMSPFAQMRFPDLRFITNSGGVFPPELVQRYRAHLPTTRIYLMYGLSEAFRSTYLPPEEIEARPQSIGKAIPETEIFVVGTDGRPCAAGEAGELVHRGPTVALGYWNDPAATAAMFRTNPLLTGSEDERVVYSGDIVQQDQDGFVYFVGRRDQMIKTQGYRVSPDEVEEAVRASGLVANVIVHGAPDAVSGMIIVAHVIPVDALTFTVEALLRYCRGEMPPYMVPREIHLHDSLPTTANGKIDRARLREQVCATA